MSKKAQVAVEFLTTYGWVIVGVIILIAVLLYYGMFDPLRFVSRQCNFEPGLPCTTYKLESNPATGGATFIVQLSNNLGYDISLPNQSLALTVENIGKPGRNTYIGNCSPTSPAVIKEGATFTCIINITDNTVIPSIGKNVQLKPALTYQNCLTAPNYLTSANCSNATTYTTSGSTITQMEAYSGVLYCGDGICSPQIGETPATCPVDCAPPATIILNASPSSSIPPDGITQSNITATVTDANGSPMKGMSVLFTSMPIGDLSSASAFTNANGVANVTLTSTKAGTAVVMGIASTISNTTPVTFNGSSQGCGTITQNTVLLTNLVSTTQCINFGSDNIVLDCRGHQIVGVGSAAENGIFALGRKNITIINCTLSGWRYGIEVADHLVGGCTWNGSVCAPLVSTYSSGITLSNLTLNNNYYGIYLYGTSNSTFSNIQTSGNSYGIYAFLSPYNETFTNISSVADGTGIHFGYESHNITISNSTFNRDMTGVEIKDLSYNNLIINSTFTNIAYVAGHVSEGYAIYLEDSSNTTITGVTINASNAGITVDTGSSNTTITNSTLNGMGVGVWVTTYQGAQGLPEPSHTIVSNITVTSSYQGIYFDSCTTNVTLANSTFSNNSCVGISMRGGTNVTVDNVTVTNNGQYGTFCGGITVEGASEAGSPNCPTTLISSTYKITNSVISNNTYAGIIEMYDVKNLTVYNNLINNTHNLQFYYVNISDTTVNWSTSTISGTRIYPPGGTLISGNYWTHPNGACQGTPNSCASYNPLIGAAGYYACVDAGCGYYVQGIDIICNGTATPCSYFFPASACTSIPGCSWNQNVINLGYSDTCTRDANGFCNKAYDVYKDMNCSGGGCSVQTDYYPIAHP